MTTADKTLAAAKKKGGIQLEQIEAYRKAIAPLQESLALAKATRQRAFLFVRKHIPATQE